MGKVQTRRSISIRGETYDRLRAWCESHHESMSELLERLIAGHIGPGTAYRPLPSVGVGARAQEKRTEKREAERRARVIIPPADVPPAAVASEPSPAPIAPAQQSPAAPPPQPVSAPEFRPFAPTPLLRPSTSASPPIVRPAESYRPIRSAAPRPRTSIAQPSPLPAGVRVYRDEPAQDVTDHRGIRF